MLRQPDSEEEKEEEENKKMKQRKNRKRNMYNQILHAFNINNFDRGNIYGDVHLDIVVN